MASLFIASSLNGCLIGMSLGREIVQEKSLPRRSEYERSAIDFLHCSRSK